MWKNKKAIGRRKEAVARVYLTKGSGKITVNDRDYKVYFPLMYLQNQVELPLKTINGLDKFDALITVSGGGQKGQAEAIKLGLSRALCNLDVENRVSLKPAGLLTRPRSVERKKFGHKKARRSYQFSKR
ncbi:MAG: 30S ribosomal protein S9 [Bacteroidota bacterium]|nr:MAG: 30S ribosomal protein S9 [Bacteroidota bacterium]